MVGLLLGISAGFLAHFTDGLFKAMERGRTPPTWILLSRYGVGYLTTVGVQIAMANEERTTRSDVGLVALAAGVFVGLGVILGHFVDYLREVNHEKLTT